MWRPLLRPHRQLERLFRSASFSILASLSRFILSWTSKHSPLFFPFLMVPVTVRKPFRLVCFTRLDFSLVEMSFSCFKVMLMPWPPIGSDLTLSVFRISMASSLALILIKVDKKYLLGYKYLTLTSSVTLVKCSLSQWRAEGWPPLVKEVAGAEAGTECSWLCPPAFSPRHWYCPAPPRWCWHWPTCSDWPRAGLRTAESPVWDFSSGGQPRGPGLCRCSSLITVNTLSYCMSSLRSIYINLPCRNYAVLRQASSYEY